MSTEPESGRRALCPLDDLPQDNAREIRIAGTPPAFVILIRRGDAVHGWLNVCPHAGRPLNWAPDRFLFSPEDQLVCAAHGATFDIASGDCVTGPCAGSRLTAFAVEVRDGAVWPV